jgi:protein-tyrosine phosphatase
MGDDQPRRDLKQTLQRVLPNSWLKERETFLRLGPKAGPIYAGLRFIDLLGLRSQNAAEIKPGSQSFLFVCFGNIMRSPMAEALLRKAAAEANLQDIRVASAGLHAIPGNPAHPRALAASTELGLPLTDHRGQLLTPEMVSEADAIFAMDFQNKAELLSIHPESAGKILMLSAYAEGAERYREIADPYFGDIDSTRKCYGTLQTCIRNLMKTLVAPRNRGAAVESDTVSR